MPSSTVKTDLKEGVTLEEEPRKLKVELPALLQDLGQSKLLLKYQKQKLESDNCHTEDNTANITSAESNKQVEKDQLNLYKHEYQDKNSSNEG